MDELKGSQVEEEKDDKQMWREKECKTGMKRSRKVERERRNEQASGKWRRKMSGRKTGI